MAIRSDDHRRFPFFNDSRSGEACTGQQSIAVIDRYSMIATQLREIRLAAPLASSLSNFRPILHYLQAYMGRRSGRSNAPVDNLNRHRLAEPLIETAVDLLKRFDDSRDALAAKPTSWQRNLNLVALTDIAHIGHTPVVNVLRQNAGFFQECLTLRLHLAEQGIGLLPVQRIDATGPGAHEIKGKRSGEESNGTHDSCSKRHNEGWRTQGLRDAKTMHRPGTAEGKYRDAMWVLSALHGMDTSGIRHTFIYNLMDAPCCLFDGEAQRVSNSFSNGELRGF